LRELGIEVTDFKTGLSTNSVSFCFWCWIYR